jgi:hypothetical protein
MNRLLLALLFSLSALFVLAQNATIKGFVYEKGNGEAVPFINVFLKGTSLGANTDLNGFFSINRVPPGSYQILITSLDFDTIKETVSVKAGEILNKKFFATKGGINIEEVEVSTTSAEKIENTSVGIQKIDPIVINKLPSVGEPDIAQYLQVLPGVVFTGDQGGQLYIRGGLPVQNKVLLDGLIVYNPFHSIGLFSVFDTDIMKNADVYSAGFGAEYGGRTSSIMDITTRDGNKKRIGGKVSASTFGAKVLLEGPFKKLTETGNTSASYIISAKHSYLPQTSKVLYPYANSGGLPFYYTDLYAKAAINSTGGSKVSVFGFSFNDKVDYSNIASFAWQNNGLGTNFLIVPQASNLLMEGTIAYSSYKINFHNPSLESDSKSSSIGGFNAGFNFVKFFGKQELRYGFETVITSTDYQVQNPNYAVIKVSRSTTDVAAFVKHKFIGKSRSLVFEPSFRFQYYASLNVLSPEPRAAIKVNFTKKIRFKGAAGLYSQTLFSASNDRDIVNLFYGYINGPNNEDLSKTYLTSTGSSANANSSVQKATHVVAGFEFDILKHFDLNVEVYQKFFKQILNTNRDKVYEDNTSNAFRPDALKKNFVIEQGRARGFDVTLKYDRKRFYFWAVYSLTFNDRWVGSGDSVINYRPNYDRRHNVNLVSSYTFGKKKNWELNARWNFGTGFPFTQTQGYINTLNPSGSLTYNFPTGNGNLNYIPAALNQGRLPAYHRFDVGVKYRYRWNEHVHMEVNAGATNVYNRPNIFYVDRFTFKRFNQLPIMPSVNVTLGF